MGGTVFYAPTHLKRPRSKPIPINLNWYRNAHPQVSNNAKKKYKELMSPQFKGVSPFQKVSVTFTVFFATRHKFDLGNVCSVSEKFFLDAFVEAGLIEDDNYHFIPEINYRFGGLDKLNPRVEIFIKEIK